MVVICNYKVPDNVGTITSKRRPFTLQLILFRRLQSHSRLAGAIAVLRKTAVALIAIWKQMAVVAVSVVQVRPMGVSVEQPGMVVGMAVRF